MKEQLTKTQEMMLSDIKKLPRKFRHMGRARGTILEETLEIYDRRSLNGLFHKGYLRYNDYGVEVVE